MNATLTRWDPFKDLEAFGNRLASTFKRSPSEKTDGDDWFTMPEWAPPVDIVEDDKEYLIKTELPEVKKNELQVSVENGILLIKGERKFEKEEKNKRYHRVERSYGSFLRSFAIPEDADPSKVIAEFKEGLLQVHLPKKPDATPKHIDVKVN